MIPEKLIAELNRRDLSEFHNKLFAKVKGLVDMSRNDMSQHYDKWENAELIYEGKRPGDEDSKSCKDKKELPNIVIPLTYAQIQTFIAFAMNLLTQRKTFFELEATGEEDVAGAKLGEALLDRDLEYNNFVAILYQFLLDICRFGIGAYKHSWVRETERVWVKKKVAAPPTVVNMLGRLFNQAQEEKEEEVQEERVAYLGNKITSVSPYQIYPDTRLPLLRFQEGEFCASEEDMTRIQLARGEVDGIYVGVKFIEKFKEGGLESSTVRRRSRFRQNNSSFSLSSNNQEVESCVVVTSVQIDLIPSEYKLSDGSLLGESKKPEKWLVEYANDHRIIRCQPLGYSHNKFTYAIGQYSIDQLNLVNETISQVISHLQSVIDWFINSHITNVKKHITNRLIVDPAAVVYEDIRDHKPVIRLKPSAVGVDIRRHIQQLEVSDLTRNHINDVQSLLPFIAMSTAISDNVMGNYHTGRRSAREASNTANASGSRLRNLVKILFDTSIKPSGRDMLSNHRDGLDEDTFVSIMGDFMTDWSAFQSFTKEGITKVKVNRTSIAGRYDFKVFEGILPSDKHLQAETIEQTLLALMRNPNGIGILTQVLGYDPAKLFKEALELRGVKNPDRFKIAQYRVAELQKIQQEQQILENGTTGQNRPADQQPTGPVQG